MKKIFHNSINLLLRFEKFRFFLKIIQKTEWISLTQAYCLLTYFMIKWEAIQVVLCCVFFAFFVHLEKWWCCSMTLLLSHPYDPKHHEKCVFFSVLNQPSHTFFLCYVLVVFEGMTWRTLLKKRSFMEGAGTHHKFLNSLAFPHLWWHTWETWHFYHNYYVNYINNLTKQLK